MAKVTLDMVLEYAQVFEKNMDKGNAESTEKWLRDLAKSGGQTKVNCYFTSEDQIAELEKQGFEATGINPKNGEAFNRIKDGNPEFGIGKYIVLKRPLKDVKEFKNKKTGEFEEMDFGGLPKIVDLRDFPNKRYWDVEVDGELGNGTEAKVQFDLYKGTPKRLEAIGVTNLVEWSAMDNQEDELFKVA